MRKDEHIERLKISYNPKDTTYNTWTGDSRERGANITMTIKPDEDDFIIHYDALLLEDIEYYLENRIDRPNYFNMMPILRGLKKKLIEEKEQEKHFVNALKNKMVLEVPQFADHDVEGLIWKCVQWWKEEVVTIWKRPISKDDKKAMDMITKRVKSQARKKFKIKGLEIGVDNIKKVLCWSDPSVREKYYVGFGLTKKQFIDGIVNFDDKIRDRFEGIYHRDYTKSAISREMFDLKDGKGHDLAKENKGKVMCFFEEGFKKEE